jgi:hypothetical protein
MIRGLGGFAAIALALVSGPFRTAEGEKGSNKGFAKLKSPSSNGHRITKANQTPLNELGQVVGPGGRRFESGRSPSRDLTGAAPVALWQPPCRPIKFSPSTRRGYI